MFLRFSVFLWVFTFAFVGVSPVPGSEKFSKAIDAQEFVLLDASFWPPRELQEELPELDWVKKNIGRWFDRVTAMGVNVISVSVFNREGDLFMKSPALQEAGFEASPYVEILDLLCEEAKRRNVSIDIPLEDLAHIIQGNKEFAEKIDPKSITPEVVSKVIDEIGEAGKRHGIKIWIDEEAFDEQYIEFIARAAKKNGIHYLHLFEDFSGRPDICVSEDFSTYPKDLAEDEEDRKLWKVISAWGGNSLGIGNLVFGSQAARKKPAGVATSGGWGFVPGCELNVALFRAVQFKPDYFGFFPGWTSEWPDTTVEDEKFCREFDFGKTLVPLLEKFMRKHDESRPVANLILCPPPTGSGDDSRDLFDVTLHSSIDLISQSCISAGFDFVVTKNEPVAEIPSLTWVLASGRSDLLQFDFDLSESVSERVLDQTSRAIVQCAGVPSRKPEWEKIRKALGFRESPEERSFSEDDPGFSPIPEFVTWNFSESPSKVRYRGWYLHAPDDPNQLGKVMLYQFLSDLRKRVGEDTVIHLSDSMEYPLITERKGKFFVNGNVLHLEVSQIIANLISTDGNPVFETPTFAYLSKGEKQTAVFAAGDTNVGIQLRHSGSVFQWDAKGNAVSVPTVRLEGKRLAGTLRKWNLAIVR